MGNIRQAFRQLRDAETGCKLSPDNEIAVILRTDRNIREDLSENRFSLTVAGEFLHIKALDGLALLFDIFSWHAFFPFPELHTDGGVPHIDEDAFIRAVCLLGQNPTPRYAPRFFPAAHDSSTGCWGPHHVWLVTNRGKERSDFLRRLFRSLAVYNGTSVSYRTKILVPRVFLSQPLGGEPNDDGDAEYEHEVVIEKENELSVDIQDTLAECSPDNDDRLTANPLRESYELVLPLLPHHTHDLANLHVPTTKLVTFIHFLQQVQAVEEEPGSTSAELSEEESELDPLSDLIVSAEQLSIEGRLDWGLFDTVMSKDAVTCYKLN